MGLKSTECGDGVWEVKDVKWGDWMLVGPLRKADDDQFRYVRGGGGGRAGGRARSNRGGRGDDISEFEDEDYNDMASSPVKNKNLMVIDPKPGRSSQWVGQTSRLPHHRTHRRRIR